MLNNFLDGLLLCQIIEVWHKMSDKIRYYGISIACVWRQTIIANQFRIIAIRALYDG